MVKEKNFSIKKNTFYALLLIFPISFLAKVYQYNFTSGLNFGIMQYIKRIVETGQYMGSKSYDFPARIYSVFKFLGFTTHLQWSIFYTVIFTIIMFVILIKYYRDFSKMQYLYIYASMFLLSWTVFNMNKDLIQLIFLLVIFFIFKNSKISDKKKILLAIGVCIVESLFFREYYIILACLLAIIYYCFRKKNEKDITKKDTIKYIIFILACFFLSIYITKFLSFKSYTSLVNRREALQDMDNVTTIIKNVISGNSYPVFMVNYIINLFRVCVPIELIKYGPKQIVFFLYQAVNTYVLFKSIKKINKYNMIWVTFILAYTMMLVASESDFGTLARHQSVLLLYYIELFKNLNRCNKEITNEREN